MFGYLVGTNILVLLAAIMLLDARTLEFWFLTLLVLVPSALLAFLHAKQPSDSA